MITMNNLDYEIFDVVVWICLLYCSQQAHSKKAKKLIQWFTRQSFYNFVFIL